MVDSAPVNSRPRAYSTPVTHVEKRALRSQKTSLVKGEKLTNIQVYKGTTNTELKTEGIKTTDEVLNELNLDSVTSRKTTKVNHSETHSSTNKEETEKKQGDETSGQRDIIVGVALALGVATLIASLVLGLVFFPQVAAFLGITTTIGKDLLLVLGFFFLLIPGVCQIAVTGVTIGIGYGIKALYLRIKAYAKMTSTESS